MRNFYPEKKVLLVDDDEAIHIVLKMYLSRLGVSVLRAFNGREAIELMRQTHVDLVVTDIQMPKMSGYEMIKEMHGLKEMPQVIAMSSKYTQSLQTVLLKYGVKRFLKKPVSAPVFLKACSRALDE